MGVINVESLLKPITPEAPTGENLKWDRRFLEVERLAEGKEGTQFSEAEEPNWREVRDGCVEVLARGRHLKMGVLLTLAAVRLEGYTGLRDGLAVVQGYLQQYWDTVYPQLDAEDNNDPTERVNSLFALTTPLATFGDKLKFLDRIYEAPLCDGQISGKFSLRDVAIAAGTLAFDEATAGRPKPTLALIDSAFKETDPARLAEIDAAIDQAALAVQAIDQVFNEKLRAGEGPNLQALKALLKDASVQLKSRTGQAVPEGAAAGGQGGPAAGGGGGGGASLSGEVTNAQDAVRAMEKVIAYYERYEPSSPVPIIVKGALLMVGRGFLDITTVLDPSAIEILKRVSTPIEPPAT